MAQIPGLTLLHAVWIVRAKTSIKIKILADKIYYNFSQKYPTITNI